MMYETFKLDFPLERTHCGLIMGNGNFGAMIWGDERLHITVNRADFWDHRGGELIVPGTTYQNLGDTAERYGNGRALEKAIPRHAFPENVFKPQRLPVGRFEFAFAPGIKPLHAELQYRNGTVTITLSDGNQLLLDLSLHEPVILLRDNAKSIAQVVSRPAWDFPQSREWLEKYGFSPPERLTDGWVQSCPEDPSLACRCVKNHNGYAITLELGANNAAAMEQARKLLVAIDSKRIIDHNATWWQRYWSDVPEIILPDDWFNRFYQYSLYKFAAATHPDGYACGLQGPWVEEYQQAQWSSDYHFNVNVQQIYSLAFATGKLEHLLPLFDMVESEPFHNALKHNAKVMFAIDNGLWFTHAVDDRGQQCGWLIPGSVLDPACGAWTALLYWQYYQYSGDKVFLKNRAWPFIRGIMRGYEAMLREYHGRLSIPLGVSAEYGCSNPDVGHAGRDASYQLAAAHMLADCLLEAASVLGEKPEAVWLDIKARLPQFTTVEGKDTSGKMEKRIAIWEGQDLDTCHRHHSHLACIYPFATLCTPSGEQAEIIDNSIDHWILQGMGQWSEWCMPWAAIIHSRLGFTEAPMILFNTWRQLFVNEGMSTVYLPRSRGIIAHRRHDLKKPKETTEIMQLDGTMGAATAFLEMLAHQHGNIIKIFQGIPEHWHNVSFKNIRLPNSFRISAERKNGQITHISVNSQYGGDFTIQLDGQIMTCHFQPNETRDLQKIVKPSITT